MKIHKLWAENVRGISDRVTVELSPVGLNLISAPNEMGKTTISEILQYLFEWQSNSVKDKIKRLQPYGKDVAPLMGAEIEVKGTLYKIEKRWLKEKKTEVEVLAPRREAFSGNDAEKKINEIFHEHLDQTVWRMIQVAQAEFNQFLQGSFNSDQRDALRTYLSKAVTTEATEGDQNLDKDVQEKYLQWFTPTGLRKTANDTAGKELVDTENSIKNIDNEIFTLKERIAAVADVPNQLSNVRESREVLQKRRDAQKIDREVREAEGILDKRTRLASRITEILTEFPLVKSFSKSDYEWLNENHLNYVKYKDTSSLKMTALDSLKLEINHEVISLEKGEVFDQKLVSPLNIQIPHLLSIDFIDESPGQELSIKEIAEEFERKLALIKCTSFKGAQEMKEKFDEINRLEQSLNELLEEATIEKLTSDIEILNLRKLEFPNWEIDVTAAEVSEADLQDIAQEMGKKEGQSEEISRNGWHTSLEEKTENLRELRDKEKRLIRESDAIHLLFNTLANHKENAEKNYSVHFSRYINELARSFYGEDVDIEISDSFEILSRRMSGQNIAVADLSTGAKEQLAILIRLALTRIVEIDEPFPVILDDEFAHSDPQRISMMHNVFTDFSDQQQFILLTCNPGRFAIYEPAKTIDLAEIRGR